MLGIVLTGLFCLGAIGVADLLVGRWAPRDPYARIGALGLLGLGFMGTATFLLLLLPSGATLAWLVPVAAICGVVRAIPIVREVRLPKLAGAEWLFPVAYVAAMALALVGVLAAPSAMEWDTLAYHLAVPKLWAAAGRADYISFIHHSNFPPAVDCLFFHGLRWGGVAGAKAFSIAFYKFGALVVFGEARTRSTAPRAGWWSMLAYLSVPVFLWESGTAYVDLAHGLFAGLAIWYASRFVADHGFETAAIGILFAGLAVGSKYTGLLTMAIVVAYAFLHVYRRHTSFRPVILVTLVAALIGCPAYVRNVANTGNPVYPFLYSRFGGKNWDAYSDEIYRNEQATFGVGRTVPEPGQRSLDVPNQPARLGAAILGLAYQPGRYTNPNPLGGTGWPFQAVGFLAVAILTLAMFIGDLRRESSFAVVGALVTLVGWVFMSQQSRYISTVAIPLAIVAAEFEGLRRRLLQVGVVVQTVVTLYTVNAYVTRAQLEAMKTGAPVTRFGEAADVLNKDVKPKRVALYNELFGFLLDVPYFWANPGHSTELGYAELEDGAGLAEALKRIGCDTVYIASAEADADRKMFDAMQNPSQPYYDADSAEVGVKWRRLVVDAVRTGRFQLVKPLRHGVIFHIQ